ncbi:GNAT family N-acetyltransferase [Clostridium estertheticum]|uniref:GNAT family N-acetyltransferase n=1 Tax=Clostridium estertheticum TaxID=238834 RepID=UPI001CD1308A|nr:GNAT family N-acetyltransferase [Clostridium estertheticum]MBZ9687385.1 GNAT family N-acetyltransferase [Clostridium estertheticum]
MDFKIRRLQETDDMVQLLALSKAFFEEYETHHDYFFKIDSVEYEDISGYFNSWLNNDNKAAFLALLDDRIIGYITVYVKNQASFWKIKQIADISGLMVEKSMRKYGVASELMKAAMAFLIDKKIDFFTLFTSSNNIEAIEFYKKIGMETLYTHLMGSVNNTVLKIIS